jgi:outer membrane immunogenic protein
MLKKLLSTTALCTIPFASYAADLPVKARPPVVAVYNWTGFYVGGNIGYSWGRSDVTLGDDFSGLAFATSERLKPSGVIGGVQAGYNWQASRNWVWGVEADFQWSGQKDSVSRSLDFGPESCGETCTISGTAAGRLESKLTWLGTVRGRVGFVADSMPTVLWYGTGGLAYGRVKTSGLAGFSASGTNGVNCEGGSCDFTATGSATFSEAKTKVGWALGAGVEGAWGNDWTWKVEYLYVDLGTVSGITALTSSASCTGSCGFFSTPFSSAVTYSNKMTDNIVRIGFNRKFHP